MEPEIIAVMGTIIAALVAALAKMGLYQRNNNNKPRDNAHHGNPGGVVDLRTTKLGDMSAAWYEEKHEKLLTALEDLTRAVRGESA